MHPPLAASPLLSQGFQYLAPWGEDFYSAPTVLAKRRALVIGNDSYEKVDKLRNAREDANSMARSLQEVGYEVTLKNDLTEKEMKATLRAFKAQVEGGDEVMLFFAGHGVEFGKANYLLPIDIAGESEEQVKDDRIPS